MLLQRLNISLKGGGSGYILEWFGVWCELTCAILAVVDLVSGLISTLRIGYEDVAMLGV